MTGDDRLARLIRRRYILMTKGGDLHPSEVIWLKSLEKEIQSYR